MKELKPSHFANHGQPCCSRWGKSEIEWIALAYVKALANSGDTWKRLSREETLKNLSEKQRASTYGMLQDDYYAHWFDLVSEQIIDAEGALGVGGFWNALRRRP